MNSIKHLCNTSVLQDFIHHIVRGIFFGQNVDSWMTLSATHETRWSFSSASSSYALSYPPRKDEEKTSPFKMKLEISSLGQMYWSWTLKRKSSHWSTKVISDQCCLPRQHSMFLVSFMIVHWIWKSTCGVLRREPLKGFIYSFFSEFIPSTACAKNTQTSRIYSRAFWKNLRRAELETWKWCWFHYWTVWTKKLFNRPLMRVCSILTGQLVNKISKNDFGFGNTRPTRRTTFPN